MSESSAKLRAVVDSNLFVSGTILKRGTPYALLEAWRAQRFIHLLSARQHRELSEVFRRPAITYEYHLTQAELNELFTGLDGAVRVEPVASLPVPVRDPKDEPILAAALGGGADYLVTGDNDLLTLSGDPRIGQLKIVTASAFLAVLAGQA